MDHSEGGRSYAVEAYLLLQGLEHGDLAAMNTVARTALIGPLEEWRRFELAVGLAVGEALGAALGAPIQLHLLGGDSSLPIISVGRFAIYWQQRTAHYNQPTLEPSEVIVRDVLTAYGLSIGADRPDFVVVDRDESAVIAVVEVKYLAGDTGNARFREATDQIVRYARGYAAEGQSLPLIARSLIALSKGAPAQIDASASVPFSVDFEGIMRTELASWASRVAAPH